MSVVVALRAVAARLREQPGHADRMVRLARKQRIPTGAAMPPNMAENYYLAWADRIRCSWLGQLNEEELELRLAIDQQALIGCDEDEEFDLEERLDWTLKELARRGGIEPRGRLTSRELVFQVTATQWGDEPPWGRR